MRTKAMAKKRESKSKVDKKKPELDGGCKSKTKKTDKETKRRFRPGTVALREIRKAQGSLGNKAFPKSKIASLVRSTLPDNFRISKNALSTIKQAAESYLTDIFCLTNTLAIHRNRLGPDQDDMRLAQNLFNNAQFVKEQDASKKFLKAVASSTKRSEESKKSAKAPTEPKDKDNKKVQDGLPADKSNAHAETEDEAPHTPKVEKSKPQSTIGDLD